jgi:5-formaminoimidazole-4-carboxamide-1-(beta)-D-ribofuranosyl 5'-monophosphate synthetase
MVQLTQKVQELASGYKNPTISVLGSHSALDISQGAKSYNIPNLVVAQKGRDVVYSKHYINRKTAIGNTGCVDEVLTLDKFSDIVGESALNTLKEKQAIFVPHRSFSVYVGYDNIENNFEIPIFGNRQLLRAEERGVENNQRDLLLKAGIKVPETIDSPDKIDRLCIIKASEAKRSYERAFFFASSPEQYYEKSKKMIEKGIITKEGADDALIEEFVLGTPFNLNYFYSPLTEELELLGIDTRRQTNLDGWLHLPAEQQLEIKDMAKVNNIEAGHIACTLRESLLSKVYKIGEQFVETCKQEYAPGLIGPFALQGALVPTENGEEFYIFDVSFRVPGSPGTRFTPYPEYMYNGASLSVGKRIALEVKTALETDQMKKIVT